MKEIVDESDASAVSRESRCSRLALLAVRFLRDAHPVRVSRCEGGDLELREDGRSLRSRCVFSTSNPSSRFSRLSRSFESEHARDGFRTTVAPAHSLRSFTSRSLIRIPTSAPVAHGFVRHGVRGRGFEPDARPHCVRSAVIRIPLASLLTSVRRRCEGGDSNRNQTCSLRCARLIGFESSSRRFGAARSCAAHSCEGGDSNPWTPTGAGLKPAAFGLAQPPSRTPLSQWQPKSGFESPRNYESVFLIIISSNNRDV